MTKAAQDKMAAELKSAIAKNKRLQKEKRNLESDLANDQDCKRAHIQCGHQFEEGHRVYGTHGTIERLREVLNSK